MPSDVTIKITGLWKRYGLPVPRFVQKGLNLIKRKSRGYEEDRWALKDVNLEVRRGETLGIVGRNGAGKSTLLKVLAGVTAPTKGRVEIFGRIFPMIELNAGLHTELTGRENVRLLGAVMGLSKTEIERILPEVEDFTELGEWFDEPVRMYSSGMLSRLGFGVAVNIKSDVVLIDETFAVGDLKFQNKSFARVKEMRESGATILLVSHSLETLQFVAKRGILLEQGSIISDGSALHAINAYETLVFHSEQKRLEHRVRSRISSEDVNIFGARMFDENGDTLNELRAGRPFGIEVDLQINRDLEHPMFSLGILNAAGILCKWNVSKEDGLTGPGPKNHYILKAWYPENNLSTGAYEAHFATRDAASFETLERIAGIVTFSVVGPERSRGIVRGKVDWRLVPFDEGCACSLPEQSCPTGNPQERSHG
jgi:homopolymeric O-antigen transport system ATP-binding protein